MKTERRFTIFKVNPNIDYVYSLNKYVFVTGFRLRKTKRKKEWTIDIYYQDLKQ